MRPLKILTWHVHGDYLHYLSHVDHEFYLPVKPGHPEGYGGRSGGEPWPANLIEVPAEEVPGLPLDCVLYQSSGEYLEDRQVLLSPAQQRLPTIFLEHDPPREHPTDTRHVVDDPNALLVHVTEFNELMWDNGRTPTLVIPHGVSVPDDVHYTGELKRGLSILNNPVRYGRCLGTDLYQQVAGQVFLHLIGAHSEEIGGLGSVRRPDRPQFVAPYRFLFNPVRYASPSLAVCEAMMLGMPIVALATAEMAATIENGVSGYIDTNVDHLVTLMQELLDDRELALHLSAGARRAATERFSLARFVQQWDEAFRLITDRREVWQAGTAPATGDELDLHVSLPPPEDADERAVSAQR